MHRQYIYKYKYKLHVLNYGLIRLGIASARALTAKFRVCFTKSKVLLTHKSVNHCLFEILKGKEM